MAKGQLEGYICAKGHRTVTIALDDGAVDRVINCQHRCKERVSGKMITCGQPSHGQGPKSVHPDEEAEFAFYSPDVEERAGLNPADLVKVEQGGLLLRALPKG